MIITFNNKTFNRYQNDVIFDKTGAEVSPGLYDVESYTAEEATWIDKTSFSLDENSTTSFNLGDEILLAVNGFDEKNVISETDYTNKKYKVTKIISMVSSTLTVVKNFVTYTPSGLTDGEYYFFGDNEAIFVSNRFASVYIPFKILSLRNQNLTSLLKEYETGAFNLEADNSIWGDLSYIEEPYKIVDIGQYRELKILKILALVESAKFKGETSANTQYDNFLKKVVNNVKVNSNGSVNVAGDTYDSWDISFGS